MLEALLEVTASTHGNVCVYACMFVRYLYCDLAVPQAELSVSACRLHAEYVHTQSMLLPARFTHTKAFGP